MPYIYSYDRKRIDDSIQTLVDKLIDVEKDKGISYLKGVINYTLTKILKSIYAQEIGTNKLSYSNINDAIGILECVKLELYREVAAPYEDEKKNMNGSVEPFVVNREIKLGDIWEFQECE
jgi:hypothetical protein